jgi:hypothetical protein
MARKSWPSLNDAFDAFVFSHAILLEIARDTLQF